MHKDEQACLLVVIVLKGVLAVPYNIEYRGQGWSLGTSLISFNREERQENREEERRN